jgi:hypothetical protein
MWMSNIDTQIIKMHLISFMYHLGSQNIFLSGNQKRFWLQLYEDFNKYYLGMESYTSTIDQL